MPISLEELARHVQGTVVGDAAGLSITGAATLETAGQADVTLIDAADKLHLLAKSRACKKMASKPTCKSCWPNSFRFLKKVPP